MHTVSMLLLLAVAITVMKIIPFFIDPLKEMTMRIAASITI